MLVGIRHGATMGEYSGGEEWSAESTRGDRRQRGRGVLPPAGVPNTRAERPPAISSHTGMHTGLFSGGVSVATWAESC